MIINQVEIIEFGESIKIKSLIEFSEKKEYLWYLIPKKYGDFVTTEKLDGFLVGLLLLAMKRGEDLTVNGAISRKLYFNLVHSFIPMMQVIMPELKKIQINVSRFDDGSTYQCNGSVVTGFSAGVDSFCAIYDHYYKATSPYKITHFVFNNVGSHNEWDSKKGRELFDTRYDVLKWYPKRLGIDFIKIDSNLSDFLQWSFIETHIPRNISTILLLQKLFGKYYYSSSTAYIQTCGWKNCRNIAQTECASVHLLSTETLECISTGCQQSRVEKTKKLSKIPKANLLLNVCISPSSNGKNCSICHKCCRTLLTLELHGIVDEFAYVFDLEKWKKVKKKYLLKNLENKNDPYIKEIMDYARDVGYSFNPFYRIVSKILNLNFGKPHFTVCHLIESTLKIIRKNRVFINLFLS